MGSYEQRGYHRERNADFRLCPDAHVGAVHAATRVLYLGALVGSAVLTEVAAGVAGFALMPMGALYGCASRAVDAGHGGAQVSGEAASEDVEREPVRGRDVLFDLAEHMVPSFLMSRI